MSFFSGDERRDLELLAFTTAAGAGVVGIPVEIIVVVLDAIGATAHGRIVYGLELSRNNITIFYLYLYKQRYALSTGIFSLNLLSFAMMNVSSDYFLYQFQ
jgi:hypothetical protein